MRFNRKSAHSDRGWGQVKAIGWIALAGLLCAPGCQWMVDDADRDVYQLIEKRQRVAIDRTSNAKIDQERWPNWGKPYGGSPDEKHEFVPHPADSQIPPAFTQPASAPSADMDFELATPATQPDNSLPVLSLSDVVRYAFNHAREFQTAKEDLYLAALALTLERHMWTPRLMGEIRTRYANYGEIRDFDHAMDVVAQTAVEQRLPYGGEVTATVVNSLMRDLTNHLTSGETGQIVLAANIPLLRGAGPVAYESRYQAERDLIYAVRTLERFRQTFVVEIASTYLDLQQRKQQILNVTESVKSFASEVDRARARWQTGRIIELDMQRAEQDRLSAVNSRLVAIENYRVAMENFKVRLGMPVDEQFDVMFLGDPEGDLDAGADDLADAKLEYAIRMPSVGAGEAVKVAQKYRLDLLNTLDRIDDRRRGVDIAENNLLPSLDAQGSVTYDTNPDRLSMVDYHDERTTWRSALNLELPLDRKTEQNALRSALVDKARAERSYEQSRDQVENQVRQAMRRVLLAQQSLRLQMLSRDLALRRREGARFRFEQGLVGNREVVDAENSLLSARDAVAVAQGQYRLAVLQFFRDTGMLRLNDEGQPEGLAVAGVVEKP